MDYAEQAVKGYRLTHTDDSPVIVEDTPEVEKGEHPFADPRFWAAFILMGDPR